MANITVSVSDAVYRQARIHAAREGTSVSALVASYLESLGRKDAEFARLAALQQSVLEEIETFAADERLDREAVHDRAVR